MARKLSYKNDIEKQEKSLTQAMCPISLTALYMGATVARISTPVNAVLRLHDVKYTGYRKKSWCNIRVMIWVSDI